MVKKCVCLALVLLFVLSLAGCWSYRGLDEMAIVAGVAIDRADESGKYLLTFEIVDISLSIKEEGPKSKLLESEGSTLFEAIRAAKQKIKNKLYFAHSQLVIISKDIAREDDIGYILDWFMRDGEARETMYLAVSQERSAQDILQSGGVDESLISMKLQKILENDNSITASTVADEVYNAYDTIHTPGKDLALAAVRTSQNSGETICESHGIAVFKDRRLVGFLTPQESKGYLFCVGSVDGGVLTFSSKGHGEDDVTLEIEETQTKRSVVNKDGKVSIRVEVKAYCFLGELMNPNVKLDTDKLEELQELAAKKLKKDIMDTIEKVQSEYGADIFGFGSLIHQKDFRLWEQLKHRWDSMFKTIQVEVETEVHIVNTAALSKS